MLQGNKSMTWRELLTIIPEEYLDDDVTLEEDGEFFQASIYTYVGDILDEGAFYVAKRFGKEEEDEKDI